MKRVIISILSVFILILLNASQIYSKDKCGLGVTLDVIRAFDDRLPVLSDEDMKAILEEAKRIISIKLGDRIKIIFRDNGTISLEDLFKDRSYRKIDFYKRLTAWQYDLNLTEILPSLHTKKFKKYIIRFLKQWDINSLKNFFPDKNINNYDDVFYNLMSVYHSRIKWLKSLKIDDNEKLVLEPLPPHQSFIEWLGYMWNQNRYDIIFTNGLIIFDLLSEPYPHAICKHAKVGGCSFFSPKRVPLDGRSLMVNIFGEYGNIEGICDTRENISRELKNKILGGFYFAHEFGHAFYMLPDVYDHGDTCLMNTSFHTMDNVKGYNLLISDLSPCAKCQPWIVAKEYSVKARLAYEKGDYEKAGELYLKGANETPKLVDANYKFYIKGIYEKALNAFQKANNKYGEKKCRRMIKKLGEKIWRSE